MTTNPRGFPRRSLLLWLLLLACSVGMGKDVRLQFKVLDARTKKPVTSFRYSYYLRTADGKRDVDRPQLVPIRNDVGEFQLSCPDSCELSVTVRAKGYQPDSPHSHDFIVTSTKKKQVREIWLKPGIRIAGRVLDARTGKPVVNAVVSPMVFMVPIDVPDRNRMTTTDKEGQFELFGVGTSGFELRHADYGKTNFAFYGLKENVLQINREFLLYQDASRRIHGRVMDAEGNPLSGVQVVDGEGLRASSDAEGAFEINGSSKCAETAGKPAFRLELRKRGYIARFMYPTNIPGRGLRVVLERLYDIHGVVLGPGGRPIPEYEIKMGPGENPESFSCVGGTVKDPTGRFHARVEEKGPHWIGVNAIGFAHWQGMVEVSRGMSALIIKPKSGVRVKARLTGIERATNLRAVLTPKPPSRGYFQSFDETPRVAMGRRSTGVSSTGVMELHGITDGNYWLELKGKHVSPMRTEVAVRGENVDLGELRVLETGTIVGKAFYPRSGNQAWPFADGHVFLAGSDEEYASFKTDENGEFVIADAPAGLLSVGVLQMLGDVGTSYGNMVQVVPGRRSVVRINGSNAMSALRVRPVVGGGGTNEFRVAAGLGARRKVELINGRLPILYVSLAPLDADEPASFSLHDGHHTNPGDELILPQVSDGRYRITITDWQTRFGTNSPHYEEEIEVGRGRRTHVARLGSGVLLGAFPKVLGKKKSPRSQIMLSLDPYNDEHFWKSLAQIVPVDGRKLIRSARPDGKGDFCFTFVRPGEYRLAICDPQRGWFRRGDLTIGAGETDLGELKLTPGTGIDCRLTYAEHVKLIESIVVRDEYGFTFDASDFGQRDPIRKGFRFDHLWPGNWTVELWRNKTMVDSDVVRLIEGEDALVEMQVR